MIGTKMNFEFGFDMSVFCRSRFSFSALNKYAVLFPDSNRAKPNRRWIFQYFAFQARNEKNRAFCGFSLALQPSVLLVYWIDYSNFLVYINEYSITMDRTKAVCKRSRNMIESASVPFTCVALFKCIHYVCWKGTIKNSFYSQTKQNSACFLCRLS